MYTSTYNFAIIGCGRIAQRHATQIQLHGKLIAICDVNEDVLQNFVVDRSVNKYNNLDELLLHENAVDVVVICTPNGLHASQSIAALNAGKHVMCEKPMALSAKDCREMMNAATSNNKRLFVVKQNRFNPPVVAVKKAVDEGRLGKLFSMQLNCFWNRGEAYYSDSWHGKKAMDGGILYTQFSHFIDLMYWLIGDVKHVHAITKNAHHVNIEIEDNGVCMIEFESGTIGTINFTINSFKKNMEGSLTLFGEKGTVKIGGQYLNELEYQSIENYIIDDFSKGNHANDYGTYTGSMSNHDKVYEYVMNVLMNNLSNDDNLLGSMKTVEIIEKIYAAANA
jgi:predicted dehydrogenase